MDMQQALARLIASEHLSRREMAAVMRQVMSGGATDAQIGALLVALRMKSETTEEIAGAAEAMRELATPVAVSDPHLVDVVGTSAKMIRHFFMSSVNLQTSHWVSSSGSKLTSSSRHASSLFPLPPSPKPMLVFGASPWSVAQCCTG